VTSVNTDFVITCFSSFPLRRVHCISTNHAQRNTSLEFVAS
jgi:hypothetical protein